MTLLIFVGILSEGGSTSKNQKREKFCMDSVNLVPLLYGGRDQSLSGDHFDFSNFDDHFSIWP